MAAANPTGASPGLAFSDSPAASATAASEAVPRDDKFHPTVASQCVAVGDGLHTAMARQHASFNIEARDAEGRKQSSCTRAVCIVYPGAGVWVVPTNNR